MKENLDELVRDLTRIGTPMTKSEARRRIQDLISEARIDEADRCELHVQQALKERDKETGQFLKNILDGIDIADKQMGNPTGGTLAIRIALISRGLLQLDKSKNI